MAGRPRTGRGMAGRDGGKETDHEAELMSRVIEGVRKAKEYNDTANRLEQEIEEIRAAIDVNGESRERLNKLDDLQRQLLRASEAERKMHDDYDLTNNLGILAALRTPDEPAPRAAPAAKSRKQRPVVEPDPVADSPGPNPSDARDNMLKRVKGAAQRSSSVASQGRTGIVAKDDGVEHHRGLLAEKAGELVVGTEVFYKFKPNSGEDGVGIQGTIKKVWKEKKPIMYDVQDPEPDAATGTRKLHSGNARELIPIPATGANLAVFANGTNVFAKYPETDTFYKAKVKGFTQGLYSLQFEGEEDEQEQKTVDKRFVLDIRMR